MVATQALDPSDRRPRPEDCLAEGGQMGALHRTMDWKSTALGPVAEWPQSLRTAASIMLQARFGMYIAWGPDFIQLYNDAYRPILGSTKHPAIGKSARDTFQESWHIIGPLFEQVRRGEAVGSDDWMLPLDRHGYLEECYFIFSYSPIRDESGGVGGVLVTVCESTQRVLGERRLKTLSDLAAEATDLTSSEEAWQSALEPLRQSALDLPFALLYEIDPSGTSAILVGATGIESGHPAAPARVALDSADSPWPLAEAAHTGAAQTILDVPERLGDLPGGPWPEPPRAAVVLPIGRPGVSPPYGLLVAGVSPRRALDEAYHEFQAMVASHVATAVANARSFAEEHQRAEALRAHETRARAAAEAAAEQFRMLAESIPQLAWMAEPDGDIFWYNRRWYEYTGTTFEQMAGWGWKAVHDPEMLPIVIERWTASLESGEPFEMEFPIRRHDGALRWFLTRVMPVRDAAGTIVRWFGTNTDVDDRKRAERRARFLAEAAVVLSARREVEETLADLAKLLVPEMADWYAVDELDEAGVLQRLTVVHPDPAKVELAWELSRRYPVRGDEPHGVPNVLRTGEPEMIADIPDAMLEALIPDPELLRIMRELKLRSTIVVPLKARGRTFAAITLVMAESGRRYDADDLAFAQEIAARAGAAIDNARLSASRDQAEAWLHEEREALATLNRSNQLLSAELDLEKLVQSLTDSATELSGGQFGAFFYNLIGANGESYTLYTISGVPRERFSRFPMPRNTAVFAPTFNGEKPVRSDDITKDPRYAHNAPYHGMPEGHLPVRSYLAVPVVSRSGEVIGGLFFGHAETGAFTERSERLVVGLASQAAIAMDNARLYREAQASARERAEIITALKRGNRELDQFAYVASHDLKAPLRGIANLSQWIEEDLADRMTPGAREQMGLLRGRVHRMEALIDGILSYSRAGRTREKVEPVDVGPLLTEIIELIAPPPGSVIEVAPDMPIMSAERVPLQQVFMNLIGNALKYAGRPDARVSVKARDAGETWELSVTDNGPGIPAEFHERIWGIFQTLESRDKVEGTGIGLSVVQKIVESRGGRAWVESPAGEGATFRFTWPKRPREAV